MHKAPIISIVTINYNNVVGLAQTMESVISQSYPNIDYVVIDGASTDGSADLIKTKNEKISYWVSEKDTGIYNAMNKGIAAAKGEYILFLNSGDRLLADQTIAEVVAPGLSADLIYGNLMFFDREKEWLWNLPDALSFQFFYRSTLPHPSTFIRKSLFESVGLYDENLKIVSDWKFFLLAIFKENASYQHINQVISAYNFDGLSSKSENLTAIEEERSAVLHQYFPNFLKDYVLLEAFEKELKSLKFIRKTKGFFKKMFK